MSQITVTNIQGQTSGGNANKVIITSGHTLEVTSNSTVGGNSTITGSLTAPDIRATAIKSSTGTASTTIANDGKVTFNSSVEQSGSTLPQLGMFKLLDTTISSAVSTFDIDSTHINSTYDDYFCIFNLRNSADNEDLGFKVFVGGVLQTGSIYGFEIAALSSSTYEQSNANSRGKFNVTNIGNATGENISGHFYMHNVNDTNHPFMMMGQSTQYNTSGLPNSNHFSTQLIPANAADVVNGIQFKFDSGNIAGGQVKLFGIK